MRILHLAKFSPAFKGGIETIVHSLATSQAQAGHNVSIVSNAANPNEMPTHPLQNLSLYTCNPIAHFFSQPISIQYITKAQELAKNADIIHLHLPNLIPTFLRKIDKPMIATVHAHGPSQQGLKFFYQLFTKGLMARLQLLVISSANNLSSDEPIYKFREKVRVIPFGIPEQDVTERKCQDYSLFVGRLVPYKGLENIVTAFTELPGKFLIAGSGPNERSIAKIIRENKLTEKVRLLGSISDQVRNELYKNCTCFILPSFSKQETFGIAALEAMSFGVPLLTTDLQSGVADLSKPGVTSLTFNSIKSFKENYLKLFEDAELRLHLSQGAIHRQRTMFSEKKMIDKYTNAYGEAIEIYKRQ